MTRTELLGRRWAAQTLNQTGGEPEAAVRRLTAVQAQDYRMSLAAVAWRGNRRTADVEAALDTGAVLRTHVLRPTWHLVASSDLRWMTALSVDHIKAVSRTNQKARGVTAETLRVSLRVLVEALREGPAPRETLVDALMAAGLAVDDNRAAHYLVNAEVELALCSGPLVAGKPTYDLVDRRVPPSPSVGRSEALALLARRYVTGHGPATDKDFAWWAGLSLTEARQGLDACDLSRDKGEGTPLWFDNAIDSTPPQGFHWLAAFDEYLIGFADRSAMLDPPDMGLWATKNGIFHPVVLLDGRVVGRWSRPERPGALPSIQWFHATPPGWEAPLEAFAAWWWR